MMGRPAQDAGSDNVRERMLPVGGKPHAQGQHEPSQRTGRGVKRSEEENGAGTGNAKRQRPNTDGREAPVLTDEQTARRVEQRQKQIDFGKNTVGYDNYFKAVPKRERIRGDPHHPQTPRLDTNVGKRQFDGQVKAWRRSLHMWDKGDPRLQVETENSEHPAEPEEDDIVPIAELDDYITALDEEDTPELEAEDVREQVDIYSHGDQDVLGDGGLYDDDN